MHEGRPGWRRANAAAIALQERCAEAVLHQANSFACRGRRHACPRGAMRDARRLDHHQEQTQIDQVKAHAAANEVRGLHSCWFFQHIRPLLGPSVRAGLFRKDEFSYARWGRGCRRFILQFG
jgi:hypothetical protein